MPGESAKLEYERIRGARREFINRNRNVIVGGGLLAIVVAGIAGQALLGSWLIGALVVVVILVPRFMPSKQELAWRKGAEGEEVVGRALDALASDGVATIHDRLIPGSRANIDHLAVSSTGVWTVDAKNYKGRVEVRARGRELWISGRNRSKLLDQAAKQHAVVRQVLDRHGHHDVPVAAALCFVGVEWPLLFPPKAALSVRLCSPRRLRQTIMSGERLLNPDQVQRVARIIESNLKPAVPPGENISGEFPASVAEETNSAPAPPRVEVPMSVVSWDNPVCECGSPMALRRRRADGKPFWGCSTFPRCRRVQPV